MLKNERAVIGNNGMSREEFLRQVLYSGELTKIAQHLALVLFLISEGKNTMNLSLRDVEKITGWGKSTIKDHISELEMFVKVTLGAGRTKSIFELQGVIEDALATAVVSATRPKEEPIVREPDAKSENNGVQPQPDAKPDANDVQREPDAKPDKTRNADAPKTAASKDITTNINNNKPTSSETVTQPAEPAGENGLAGEMLADVIGWMHHGDEKSARKWLTSFIGIHGQERTKQSYLKLRTNLLEGAVYGRPLQVWATIATDLKNNPKKQSGSRPNYMKKF